MKEIELPVFFNNDSTATLNELNLPCKLADNDVKMVTFYSVQAIMPFEDEHDIGKIYSKLFTAGDYFIINMSYTQLKKVLSEWKG